MLNIRDCKELNWFDHYETLNKLEQNKINKTVELLNECDSLKAINKKDNEYYYIFHKCSKKEGYQISFFKGLEAISDIFRNSLVEIAKEIVNYNGYKVVELV